jgi:predicted HTH transcriptional regulator
MGTGTLDMVMRCKEAGLKEPEFVQEEFFRTILWRNDSWEKSREKSKEKILKLIENNASITQNGIAEATGLSVKSIEKHIRQLKKEGLLERIGPDNGGHWNMKLHDNLKQQYT